MSGVTQAQRFWLACSILSLMLGITALFVVGHAYIQFKSSTSHYECVEVAR